MRDFRELKVWEKSHQLTIHVYKVTRRFPRDETYGLMSQIRRAATSIGANIAEGCGRSGDAEFARFLTITMGSASELEYHLLLAHHLEFVSKSEHVQLTAQVTEVKKMLTAFIQALNTDS
jgi:four helix bundle protein